MVDRVDRRQMLTLLAASAGLAALGAADNSVRNSALGRGLATFAATDSLSTLEYFDNIDKQNAQILERARGGDKVILQQPYIPYIVQISIPGITDPRFAIVTNKKLERQAILSNGPCVFDAFNDANRLGEAQTIRKLGISIGKVWIADARIPQVTTNVFVEGVGDAPPILTTTEVKDFNGKTVTCPTKDPLAGLNMRSIGRFLGSQIDALIDGVKEGLKDEDKR